MIELSGRGDAVVGTYLSHGRGDLIPLDMRDRRQAADLFDRENPDVVWIPGAMPDVDRCEREPEVSHAINVDGPANLLELAAGRRIAVVYFSTDYVFDGVRGPYREGDPPNPLQVYGAHKVEAETVLLEYPETLIVRPAWIYSDELNPRNFVYRVLSDLKAGRSIRAAMDQYNTPTPAGPLARHAVNALIAGHRGILHLTGPERMTRLALVERIADLAGYDRSHIESIRLGDLTLPARRPSNGGLISDFPDLAINERLEDMDFRQILTGT